MNNLELLEQKTTEYEKLPGLMLGLDGWILRSLPVALRRQFLQGYERLLRIVFHPDRYQDPAAKVSREKYLQSVNEAVRFMSADQFNYEMSMDAVPTKRNPFVALQQQVDARDEIIERLNLDLQHQRAQAGKMDAAEKDLRKACERALVSYEVERQRSYALRSAVAEIVKGFPVPNATEYHGIQGRVVCIEAVRRSITDFGTQLAVHAAKGDCVSSPWYKEERYIPQLQPCLKPVEELSFAGNRTGANIKIIGAMTLVHLCEFIQSRMEGRMPPPELHQTLQFLVTPPLQAHDFRGTEWWMAVHAFLLPFYVPHCFLLIKRPEQELLDLVFVQRADCSESPQEALMKGLRDTVNVKQYALDRMEVEAAVLRQRIKKQMMIKSKYYHELQQIKNEKAEAAASAMGNPRRQRRINLKAKGADGK
jgi:hypothetical protein